MKKMSTMELDSDSGLDSDSSTCDKTQSNNMGSRALQRCIKYLVHACQCREANCRISSCQKMKKVVQHTKGCKQKLNSGCPICRQLIALCCYHAKHCQETKCAIPFCAKVKRKLEHQQLQQRYQEQQVSKRRIVNMQNRTMASAAVQMNAGNSNAASQPFTGVQPCQPGIDRFVYACNNCKNEVETRHHCTVCDDFDLCVSCYEKDGHNHKMEKLGFGLDDDSSTCDKTQSNNMESRALLIQRCIKYLVHACQCRDANCKIPSCPKMKKVVQHTKGCKQRLNSGCPICRQLTALCCYHVKHCQETKCPVPFCEKVKLKLNEAQQAISSDYKDMSSVVDFLSDSS